MSERLLSFKPTVGPYGYHDPSAALFEGGELVFGTEEERYTREKHAVNTFPDHAIRACLDHAGVELPDVDRIVLPYDPSLVARSLGVDLRLEAAADGRPAARVRGVLEKLRKHAVARFTPDAEVRRRLGRIGRPVPPIEHRAHHRCHAASAFHPTGFDEALVVTVDGAGEYDATVVWHATPAGLERLRTYEYPNSLGHFYGAVTEYLGYRAFNGEGKVMGLAPYGERDPGIEATLRSVATFGADYDVTPLMSNDSDANARRLADLFDRPRSRDREFDRFEKDLAHTAQRLVEETVTAIVRRYAGRLGVGDVCLAGGVALNCKANKRVMELDAVDELFVQPVAHDGGLALGAGWLEEEPAAVEPMTDVYWGPAPADGEVEALLETTKLGAERPENLERRVAERLADGALVGWFQGRQEMGPRALGNRSILADPRTVASRDRVNERVKHREPWRPFAPSLLEEAADDYLVGGEPAPYMIKTFDTEPANREEIEAVVHPGDDTTRPQTVREEQNPRYYRLIAAFEELTGVPVLLNTSFNDHGEPIVTTPREAVRDFYAMGLDLLVVGDHLVEKPAAGGGPGRRRSQDRNRDRDRDVERRTAADPGRRGDGEGDGGGNGRSVDRRSQSRAE